MTRRIGLAQALINDPELILLDEPTSGLDPIGTREMKDLILKLKAQGKTILMCSHLLADVQDVCDRIAILHQGELKELGRVDSLLKVRDVTEIRATGLSEAAQDEIRAVIERHHGHVLTMDNPTTTLEELFLKIVRDSEAHPGRRAPSKSRLIARADAARRTMPDPLHTDDANAFELMVLESDPIVFANWIWPALAVFLRAAAVLGLRGAGRRLSGRGVSLRAAGRRRRHAIGCCATGLRDLVSLSPRRILALAWLAIQESIRRRVLVGFGVFLLILLFAGWFLDTEQQRSGDALSELRAHGHHLSGAADGAVSQRLQPAGRHQEPHDLHDRHQAGAAGRDRAGADRGLCGHRHAAAGRHGPDQLRLRGPRAQPHARGRGRLARRPCRTMPSGARTGRTTLAQNHRHQVTIDADGNGSTEMVQGHWHEVDGASRGRQDHLRRRAARRAC